MKIILRLAILFLVLSFSWKTGKSFVSPGTIDYVKGSGIVTLDLDAQKTENLVVLGKVWGFLKYHHPEVTAGKYNWDFELFKILPTVVNAKSVHERNAVLLSWISALGEVKPGNSEKVDSVLVKVYPDLDWIDDTSSLGAALSQKLLEIKNAKRKSSSHYISFRFNVGNPVFEHEASYGQFDYPDAGYRILCLFRYWNMIQYYFPYKYLIGEDWNKVLEEYIPIFVNAGDAVKYKIAVMSLVVQVRDTHATLLIGNDTAFMSSFYGGYVMPLKMEFVQNNLVVTRIINPKTATHGLEVGDVILTINGRFVSDIVEEKLPLTSGSNFPTQLRNMAALLAWSHDSTLNLQFLRGDSTRATILKCYRFPRTASHKSVTQKNTAKRDTCFKYLSPGIAYINPGTITNDYLHEIMPLCMEAKGLVLDFRHYPNDFIVFTLGSYLFPEPKRFVLFSEASESTPGMFVFTKKLSVGTKTSDYYKGKIVILINENTQSSAEYHAMAFRIAPNATVIGSTTAGADGNVSEIILPGGLKTRISGIGVYYPDGSETQRIGIVPDIKVLPTIKGVREGRDELVEKAIEIINQK